MTRSLARSIHTHKTAALEAAAALGLAQGEKGRIAARVKTSLIAAAKARSGIASDTELLEYALARVAIEDDFGPKLLRRKGLVPADLSIEV
jgi:hypothetical protein